VDFDLKTLIVDVQDHVLTITINRPEVLNAFNQTMCDEFEEVWRWVRFTDEVRVVVIRAVGDRAFCTGADIVEGFPEPENPYDYVDPGHSLMAKRFRVWKPLICAVNGMACGGAFYMLNDADIVICEEGATFFDPHVTYGNIAAFEPIGLRWRIPIGEVMRIALMGLDERMSSGRAFQIGLVSEVVGKGQLWKRADEIAHIIAAKPALATQGAVKAVWDSLDLTRSSALQNGDAYTGPGNRLSKLDRSTVERPKWTLR
jgi:enoyl-CoA hydratase/carnithine racemase